MKNIMPDYSFVREGLTLEEWLWKLVDESASVRIEAGEALQAMEWGLPSVHTDWSDLAEFPDMPSQSVRLAAELKQALAKSDFDAKLFVERLGALRLALQDDWLERASEWSSVEEELGKKYDRLAQQHVQTINSANDDATKRRAENRLAKLTAIYWRSSCEQMRTNNLLASAESMLPSGLAAYRIFSLLDKELLAAPEVLDEFQSHSELRDDALSAIERIGPEASQFAPRLIRDLDRVSENNSAWFDAAGALGAVGRNDPFIVNEMVARITHNKSAVRKAAASVLQHLGLSVCDRQKEICDRLLPMLQNEEEWAIALTALASVGRDLPSVRGTVLSLAGPREKKLRTYASLSEMEYDITMWERGTAISAMEYFTSYAEECIPVLIEAMQSFEEFDPDECYDGPLGRVAAVVAKFGERASAAVMPLVEHLEDEPDEVPTAILEALASIGPAAAPALPLLSDLQKRWTSDEDDDSETGRVDNFHDDPIGWTIQRIRNGTNR